MMSIKKIIATTIIKCLSTREGRRLASKATKRIICKTEEKFGLTPLGKWIALKKKEYPDWHK